MHQDGPSLRVLGALAAWALAWFVAPSVGPRARSFTTPRLPHMEAEGTVPHQSSSNSRLARVCVVLSKSGGYAQPPASQGFCPQGPQDLP